MGNGKQVTSELSLIARLTRTFFLITLQLTEPSEDGEGEGSQQGRPDGQAEATWTSPAHAREVPAADHVTKSLRALVSGRSVTAQLDTPKGFPSSFISEPRL